MKNTKRIEATAAARLVILDGATGTQLQARGMPGGACPELWCLQNPESIKAVHRDYREAGADIVYAATFGANRYKLAQYGAGEDVYQINRDLARLARQAAGETCLVAGDIGSTGRFVEPFGDLGFEEAVAAYKEQVRGLLEGGVDLLVIETMVDIQEARAALIAVRESGSASVGDGSSLAEPRGGLPTLIDLGAGQCIPCKKMAPILEELKNEYRGRLEVIFLDVWQDRSAGQRYGIQLIPTQIFYDAAGRELGRHEGFIGKEDILNTFRRLGVEVPEPGKKGV